MIRKLIQFLEKIISFLERFEEKRSREPNKNISSPFTFFGFGRGLGEITDYLEDLALGEKTDVVAIDVTTMSDDSGSLHYLYIDPDLVKKYIESGYFPEMILSRFVPKGEGRPEVKDVRRNGDFFVISYQKRSVSVEYTARWGRDLIAKLSGDEQVSLSWIDQERCFSYFRDRYLTRELSVLALPLLSNEKIHLVIVTKDILDLYDGNSEELLKELDEFAPKGQFEQVRNISLYLETNDFVEILIQHETDWSTPNNSNLWISKILRIAYNRGKFKSKAVEICEDEESEVDDEQPSLNVKRLEDD